MRTVFDAERLYKSIFDFIFKPNSVLMNNNQFPFWLRFSFFFVVFGIAFFLIIFLMDKSPSENFKLLLIKIGVVAGVSSFLYNILLESDPEIVD